MHLTCNVVHHVPESHGETVAAPARRIFAQHALDATRAELREVVDHLEPSFPKAAVVLAAAEQDVAADDFPADHLRKLWSTNRLERVNKELKRRCTSWACSPTTPPSSGSSRGPAEQHDDWQVSDRRYLSEDRWHSSKPSGRMTTPLHFPAAYGRRSDSWQSGSEPLPGQHSDCLGEVDPWGWSVPLPVGARCLCADGMACQRALVH